MKKYYYINSQGQQAGPIDKSLLLEAGVTRTTLVWCEGLTEWTPAEYLPDLADLFASTPPPRHDMGYNNPEPQRAPQQNYSNPRQDYNNPRPDYQNPRPDYQNPRPDYNNPRQDYNNGEKPSNYLWLAILTTILCCLPFGIVSIVYASRVDSAWYAGNHQAAIDASNKARNWGIAAAATSAVIFVIYFFIYIFALGTAASFL